MKCNSLYTLIDIVYIDPITKIQYIATPGQCYIYGDNYYGIKTSAAGVWIYSAAKTCDDKLLLNTGHGAYTDYELEVIKAHNHPVGYPGGLLMCYDTTAQAAMKTLVVGKSKYPVFESPLGCDDFLHMQKSAQRAEEDIVSSLAFPKLYAKYSKSAYKALHATDEDIVVLYDCMANEEAEFIRTDIPILLDRFTVIAKRNKLSVRECITAWQLAMHNATKLAGNKLYLGWDKSDTYPTIKHRVSRAEYEEYSNDSNVAFSTPRLHICTHAVSMKDPLRHVNKYRIAVDNAIKLGNALFAHPPGLY